MKLVFNRSDNTVVYGDGLHVPPRDFGYVDDEKYRGVDEAISAGTLIEKDVPDSVPANVSPVAAEAIKLAVADKQAAQPEVADKADEDSDEAPVRNTGRSRTNSKQKGA